jgi:hypothetical protein
MPNNKLLAGAWFSTLLAAAWIGWSLKPTPEPIVKVERVVEQGKKEVVVVEKVKERIVKPDGSTTPIEPKKSQYSLDIQYLPSLTEPPSTRDVAAILGYRVGTSRVWVTTGYEAKYNQLTVGLRYEW